MKYSMPTKRDYGRAISNNQRLANKKANEASRENANTMF